MSALHDRVAVVTGSSSGIGAAVATAFAELGARVVVNSVSSVTEGEQLAPSCPTPPKEADLIYEAVNLNLGIGG